MRLAIDIFREKLRSALSQYGAVSEFCRQTGIGRTAVDRWLKDEGGPSIESLDKIAEALGTTPDQLIKPPDDSIPLAKRELLSVISQLNDREIAMLGATITQLIESFRRVNGAHDRKKVDQG